MKVHFSPTLDGTSNRHMRIVSRSDLSAPGSASSLLRTVTKRSRHHHEEEEEDVSSSPPRIRRKQSNMEGSFEALEDRSNLGAALKMRFAKCQEAGRLSGESVDYFARCLQQLLLKHTSPDETDVSPDCTEQALNQRLGCLQVTLMERRALKECRSEPNHRAEFQRVLGATKVQNIASVCQEINNAKLERAEMSCASCCSSSGACRIPLKGKMPDAVRNLYFGTSLTGHWENKVSVHSLTPIAWDQQYEQAVQNLKAYRTFMGPE